MAQLRFSPEQARSVATSISRKGENAKDLLNQLDREIKAVSGWWEGDSVKAFTEEFNALKPSLDKLVECVNGISKQLSVVADAKEESEKKIVSALRS